MKSYLKTGFYFGSTSAIITTLGLMVGLNSGTHSKLLVTGGILIIAVADAFSDSLGIHISEESENVHTTREIWGSTASTFFSKLFIASSFIVPALIFNLPIAIVVSVLWGLLLLALTSFRLARANKDQPWKVVAEHLAIALVVIFFTHLLGDLIARYFT